MSNRHFGAFASSPQYSSIKVILLSSILRKEVAWTETELSVLNTLVTVMIRFPIFSILSTSQSQFSGYSQLALIYSSKINSSLVLCHLMTAVSLKYFHISLGFCSTMAFQNSFTIISISIFSQYFYNYTINFHSFPLPNPTNDKLVFALKY